MLVNLSELPVLPQHIWSKIPAKTAFNTFANKPPIIGSGPFQCVDWKKSNYLVMKANKHYWRGPAQVDQVVFEYFTNPDTLAEEMRAGLIDGCSGLLQAQMRMLAAVPGAVAAIWLRNSLVSLTSLPLRWRMTSPGSARAIPSAR